MKKYIVLLAIIVVTSLLAIGININGIYNGSNEKLEEKTMKDKNVIIKEDTKIKVSSKLKTSSLPMNPNNDLVFNIDDLKDIYLAGGCFWGVEAYMSRVYGVYDVSSGYANGLTENPSYEDLIYKNSGHAETVHIKYDPSLVTLETLLNYYFKIIDPTTLNQQGNDRGLQYRTGIYYTDSKELKTINDRVKKEQTLYSDPLVVEVLPLKQYFLAEDYHQDYLDKNPSGYCHINLNTVTEDLSKLEIPTDKVLKKNLTKLQYDVTQNGATERAFDNEYWNLKEKGIYVDIVTGEPLFISTDKYDSGSGWPSFTKAISLDMVKLVEDNSLFSKRTEIKSKKGDTHLGHVFNDGPIDKGGLRYCVNSASLKFIPVDKMKEMGFEEYIDLIK
ncbi:peptide-methionine (R)-S-oxide reductase MsrB [Helicovermis profundi]|uniref:Peptide methionine sulfoxide reductase MsrA n=1 Tax=Helicovermis profundi TaxID=3065157 RepID=A0AAU9E1R0_9FIRM|nr:hypothetical protein HLPR_05690 [Clostridia bacterium S502]